MITYNLPEQATVAIEVYNSQGQMIKALENGEKQAGSHHLEWNGKSVPSGIYFCRLEGKTVQGKDLKSEIKIVMVK
jgi:flagellar hook assembly protein FlgD